ncbi:MAG: DUF559 domain-containing protein [Solirubrobacterales bacterium]
MQGGVVSLDQMRKVELSAKAAAQRARQGGLHRVHRGVYAVGHRSLGHAALLRAAVLACGEGSVVSHMTAAAHWGLRDQWPALIDVTVPVEAGRKIDGIRCRRCRYPDPSEVVTHQGVVCTTPSRTLVDLAGSLGTPSLRRTVERAAVLKLLDLDELDLVMERAKGRRGMPSLRAILVDWRTDDGSLPDVRSDFEALVLPRLVMLGLPRPLCNEKLWIDGEQLTVDFLWKTRRLVVETDGRETHATPVAFQRDRWRDQLLVAADYRVARATWDQIHRELDSVVGRIGRALAQQNE